MKITIQMPNFNHGHYLQETINSIRQQTYQNWELLIVNDGSTDNSGEILESYAAIDDRIKIYHFPENRGLIESINFLESVSTGELLHPNGADNPLASDTFFEKSINLFDKYKDIAIVFALTAGVDEANNVVGKWGAPKEKAEYLTPHDGIREFFLSDYISGESVIIKRSPYLIYGAIDRDLGPLSDVFINEALVALHGGAYLDEVVSYTRLDPNSFGRSQSLVEMIVQAARMEKKFMALPLSIPPEAAWINAYRTRKLIDILNLNHKHNLSKTIDQLLGAIEGWPRYRRPDYYESIKSQFNALKALIEKENIITNEKACNLYGGIVGEKLTLECKI